jgi:phosphate transport system substrate-binding protein
MRLSIKFLTLLLLLLACALIVSCKEIMLKGNPSHPTSTLSDINKKIVSLEKKVKSLDETILRMRQPYLPYARIRSYAKKQGKIIVRGSDTMEPLIKGLEGKYKDVWPNIRFDVRMDGSGSVIEDLIVEEKTLGAMCRKPNSKEIAAFEKKYKYAPAVLPVALNSIAIIVNKKNSKIVKRGISLEELDSIFSKTRLRKHTLNIERWEQVGCNGKIGSRRIVPYIYNTNSGIQNYFKEIVMLGASSASEINAAEYRPSCIQSEGEKNNSEMVIGSVAGNETGIGFVGIYFAKKAIEDKESIEIVPIQWNSELQNPKNNPRTYILTHQVFFVFCHNNEKTLIGGNELDFLTLAYSYEGVDIINRYTPGPISFEEANYAWYSVFNRRIY